MVLIPATIGIVLRKNSDRWADRAEKIGAMGGLMLIGASIVAGLVSCFFKSLFFWITMNICSHFFFAIFVLTSHMDSTFFFFLQTYLRYQTCRHLVTHH